MRKLQVRVVSPWFGDLDLEDSYFSSKMPADKADALLCEWAPSDELFTFKGRKAWYCCEPWCQFRNLDGGRWPALKSRLKPGEFLNHNHRDVRFRVPHSTHHEPLSVNQRRDRLEKAVAIVSNHGGSPWRRHRDMSYRNRFITHPLVDLYGRAGWQDYQAGRLSRRGTPSNYLGELPGDWPADAKRDVLARYKVAVCLENMNEQRYFTEKLVEGVRAGCIPIYRPDAQSEEGPLAGAFWIDPRHYDEDPAKTLAAAMSADLGAVQQQNSRWFAENRELAATRYDEIFRKIAGVLAGRIESS